MKKKNWEFYGGVGKPFNVLQAFLNWFIFHVYVYFNNMKIYSTLKICLKKKKNLGLHPNPSERCISTFLLNFNILIYWYEFKESLFNSDLISKFSNRYMYCIEIYKNGLEFCGGENIFFHPEFSHGNIWGFSQTNTQIIYLTIFWLTLL